MRSHWAVESGFRQAIDTTVHDGERHVRSAHAPANFTTIRQMAHNLT